MWESCCLLPRRPVWMASSWLLLLGVIFPVWTWTSQTSDAAVCSRQLLLGDLGAVFTFQHYFPGGGRRSWNEARGSYSLLLP